jgi:hypothetical protein
MNNALDTEGLSSTADPPPSNPKGAHNAAPSPTLTQVHSDFNSQLVKMGLSPMEGLPLGTLPVLMSPGKSLLNTKLTESEGILPAPDATPTNTTFPGVRNKTHGSTPPNTKSPGFLQRAIQATGHASKAFGRVQSSWGLSSKK